MWYLLFAVLTVVAASVDNSGECPAVKTVENFNLSAYAGKWYEISKYLNELQGSGMCAQTEYTIDGDVVKVKNTNVLNGVQNFITGTAKMQTDASNTQMIISLKKGDDIRVSDLYILATDYSSYAIVSTCRFNPKTNTHRDSYWILSRSTVLEGEAKAAVDNYIANNKRLDASKLVPGDFSEEACKFTSTVSLTN